MTFIIIGVIGIAASGFLSQRYYNKANPSDRIAGSKQSHIFGGVVPHWVSLINLASVGCLMYGVIKVILPS